MKDTKIYYMYVDYDALNIPMHIAHLVEHCICGILKENNIKGNGATTHDYILITSTEYVKDLKVTQDIFEQQKRIVLKEIEEYRDSHKNISKIKKIDFNKKKYKNNIKGTRQEVNIIDFSQFHHYYSNIISNIERSTNCEKYNITSAKLNDIVIINLPGYHRKSYSILHFLSIYIYEQISDTKLFAKKHESLLISLDKSELLKK